MRYKREGGRGRKHCKEEETKEKKKKMKRRRKRTRKIAERIDAGGRGKGGDILKEGE